MKVDSTGMLDVMTIDKCKVNNEEVSPTIVTSSTVRNQDIEYGIPISNERRFYFKQHDNNKVYRVWLLPGDNILELYSEDLTTIVTVNFDSVEVTRHRVFTLQSVPIDSSVPVEISYHLENLKDSIGNRPHESQINGSDYNVNTFDLYEKNKQFYLKNKHYDGRFGNFYISQGFAKYFVGTFIK